MKVCYNNLFSDRKSNMDVESFIGKLVAMIHNAPGGDQISFEYIDEDKVRLRLEMGEGVEESYTITVEKHDTD